MNNITRSYLERSNRSFGHLPPETAPIAINAPRFEPVQTSNQVQPAPCPEPPCQKSPRDTNCPPSDPLSKFFSSADGEKALILLLILVLINEKADIKLIIALIYLIL